MGRDNNEIFITKERIRQIDDERLRENSMAKSAVETIAMQHKYMRLQLLFAEQIAPITSRVCSLIASCPPRSITVTQRLEPFSKTKLEEVVSFVPSDVEVEVLKWYDEYCKSILNLLIRKLGLPQNIINSNGAEAEHEK